MTTNFVVRKNPHVFLCSLITMLFVIFSYSTSYAVSASPDIIEQLRESGKLQEISDRIRDARSRGLDKPNPSISANKASLDQPFSLTAGVTDTFSVLVILADFSTNPSTANFSATKSDFERLLFSTSEFDNTYSMTEFYMDNSYDGFFIKGVVAGWYRLPQTYEYYVDGQNGFGNYPRNAQKMAEDAVMLANPDVDFSQFDGDNNGYVDGVFIVHAGPGAESTGSDNQIWSHAWGMYNNLYLDGVNISSYTSEPEESSGGGFTTMGVYAHEYGHFIGLPDLYDTDYSSSGIGDWSLMAGGSWNYGGTYPSFMDAWCKKELGFITLTEVTSNMIDVEIPTSLYNPVAYALWKDGIYGPEYFIIENRMKGGNDKGIPTSGLQIMHIDETQWGNSNEWRKLVAIEQADGLFELEYGTSSGNSGDVWPYNGKDHFDDLTNPNTQNYINNQTKTAVWDISLPDTLMYANFDINYSRPKLNLQYWSFSDSELGNGDDNAEPGESITFEFVLTNQWAEVTNVVGAMFADNLSINFDIPSVNIGTISAEGGSSGNSSSVNPIVFTIPVDFEPCIDSFFLVVTSDNPIAVDTFSLALNIGVPQILLVDDDNGGSYENYYTTELYNQSLPFDLWDKSVSGSPSGIDLNNYETVIWFVGDERPNMISASDITALELFLDNSGNLFMTGQSFISQLNSSDPTFLNNYLKAEYNSTVFSPVHNGLPGSPIGDGATILFDAAQNQTEMQSMTTINGSIADFNIAAGGVTGLSYTGTYKLFLMSFGFEAISSEYAFQNKITRPEFFGRVMNFFNNSVESLNPAITAIDLKDEVSNLNVINHTPEFSWAILDTTINSITQYEVKVGTGSLCSNSDNYWSSGLIAGNDTSIVYSGTPLMDGADYVFQVRVFNGVTWSDWNSQSFHMNVPPEIGELLAPDQNELVEFDTPTLRAENINDPDGDDVTYEFEVYSDAGMVTLVASAVGITKGPTNTSWVVDQTLTEDAQYFWRVRVYDGYEYSEYSENRIFFINAVNQLPSGFALVSPLNESTVETEFPVLTWNSSSDNDPSDFILYTVWISEDEFFNSYEEYLLLPDTTYTFGSPLNPDLQIFWKVKAVDQSSAEVWSSNTLSFFTPSSGCCLGDRGNANNDIDDDANISDLTFMVDYLFNMGQEPVCIEEANFNGDELEEIGISDITYFVDYLFGGGPLLPACP